MKDYHSTEVQEILNKYVTADEYGKYKPILDEIIQRRQFEFRFSPERIEQEVKNMVQNLKEIKVEDLGEEVIGEYIKGKATILLNKTILQEEYDEYKKFIGERADIGDDKEEILNRIIGREFLKTLTHEIYHTLNYKEEGKERKTGIIHTKYYGEVGFVSGRELNEVFTEKAATRTVQEKDIKNIHQGFEQTSGYEYITFISNMMAYALGVSERELLTNGLNNHEELVKFISSKFNGDMEKADDILDTAEQAALYLSNMYIQANNPQETTAEGITKTYNDFFRIAEEQIKLDNSEITPEYLGEVFYRDYRLNTIVLNFAKQAKEAEWITQEGFKEILVNTLKARTNLDNQLLDMAEVYQLGIKAPNLLTAAREGHLRQSARYYDENGEFKEEDRETILDRKLKSSIDERLQKFLLTYKDIKEFYTYISHVREDDYTDEEMWDASYDEKMFDIIKEHLQIPEKGVFSVDDSTIQKLASPIKLVEQKTQEGIEGQTTSNISGKEGASNRPGNSKDDDDDGR